MGGGKLGQWEGALKRGAGTPLQTMDKYKIFHQTMSDV